MLLNKIETGEKLFYNTFFESPLNKYMAIVLILQRKIFAVLESHSKLLIKKMECTACK